MMIQTRPRFAVAALVLAGAMTVPAASSPAQDATIPFANSGAIVDWQADSEKAIYLLDRSDRWYLATFRGTCYRLPVQTTIAFDTGVSDRFDRFSAVVTEDGRCAVDTLVRVDRPAVVGLKGKASAAN